MRGEHSGSGRNRQDRNRNQQGQQGQRGSGYQQADGFGQEDWQERVRQRAQVGRGPGASDWNYGAENLDEDEQNSTSQIGRNDQQYGQQRGGGFGGYGQGSGYAQSSGMGGYGQGASLQGGWGQSGSEQHSDERYGQHFGSQFGQSEQRSSPYGYGGQGSQQQGGMPRGQHHGKGPKGYQRSDDRIREDVSERLYHDHDVDASEIEITVSGGEVTLSGTVSSREEKRRAEECVEQCTGVKDVQNRLRVQQSSGASFSQGGSSAQGASSTQGMSGPQQGNREEGASQPRTSVHTGA